MSISKKSWGAYAVSVVLTLLVSFSVVALAQSSLADLRSATEQDPTDVSAWVELGNAYYEAGEYEDAKDSFLEAIALDYRAGDAHYGLGLSEFGRGDYQAALFAFNEVTRLFSERFDGHYNRAVTLARLRRPAESAQAFRDAIGQADPEASADDKIGAYLGLAAQLKLAGDFAGAASAYDSALDLRPDDSELAFLRAEALYRADRGLEALPDLTELEARTSDYRVSALIADIYVDQGQVDYALRSLDRAYRKAETSGATKAQGNILVKLGLLQRTLGRDADAARSFQEAARVDAGSWEALYNLGVSYLESGQTRSALEALNNALAINADSGELHLALATAYDQVSEVASAMASAQEALGRLDDGELVTQARFILGRSLYRQGDYGGAAREFEGVVQAQPNNAQAQLWAGLAEYQRGNYRTAVLYYERAVQLDPNSVEGRINLGAAYLASKRYQDAELVYQLLVQQNPQDAESYYNLGWALLSQERRGAARDAWQAASTLGYQPADQALGQYF